MHPRKRTNAELKPQDKGGAKKTKLTIDDKKTEQQIEDEETIKELIPILQSHSILVTYKKINVPGLQLLAERYPGMITSLAVFDAFLIGDAIKYALLPDDENLDGKLIMALYKAKQLTPNVCFNLYTHSGGRKVGMCDFISVSSVACSLLKAGVFSGENAELIQLIHSAKYELHGILETFDKFTILKGATAQAVINLGLTFPGQLFNLKVFVNNLKSANKLSEKTILGGCSILMNEEYKSNVVYKIGRLASGNQLEKILSRPALFSRVYEAIASVGDVNQVTSGQWETIYNRCFEVEPEINLFEFCRGLKKNAGRLGDQTTLFSFFSSEPLYDWNLLEEIAKFTR